jgi:hypothetical protein
MNLRSLYRYSCYMSGKLSFHPDFSHIRCAEDILASGDYK